MTKPVVRPMKLRRLARFPGLALLVAIALPLASCGGGSQTVAPGGGGTVSTPPAPFSFSFPQTGHSVQLVFPIAGAFSYHCAKHGSMGMRGGVLVDSTGLDSVVVGVGQGGNVFAPASVKIKPGGAVRWVNVTTRTDHTVTSD